MKIAETSKKEDEMWSFFFLIRKELQKTDEFTTSM
jgi:hypothetical protein